jgi:predicted GNAT family acetyltransferase
MFDQAQKIVSGQLAKMRWRLGLNVPVPMCPFVAAYLRRHPEQRDLVVAT